MKYEINWCYNGGGVVYLLQSGAIHFNLIVLFNQSADIKVGYLGEFEFVDSQRAHCENFGDKPMIFPDNPTKQENTMAEKELHAFSELCMFDVFIRIIRIFNVGTDTVDYSRSTRKVCK